MTAEQQEGYRILATAEGGELQGPAKIWVDNTNLATAVAPLADHFHPPNHSLTQREREIAMLAAQNSVCAALLAATRKDIIAGGGCQCEELAR